MKSLYLTDLTKGQNYMYRSYEIKPLTVIFILTKPEGEFNRIVVRKTDLAEIRFTKVDNSIGFFNVDDSTSVHGKYSDDLLELFKKEEIRQGIIMNDPEEEEKAIDSINEQLASVLPPTKLGEEETVNLVQKLSEEQVDVLNDIINDDTEPEEVNEEDDDKEDSVPEEETIEEKINEEDDDVNEDPAPKEEIEEPEEAKEEPVSKPEEAKEDHKEDSASEKEEAEEELYVPVSKKRVLALVLTLSSLAATAFVLVKKFKKKK